MGRPARGVRAIRIDPDDRVVGMIAVPEDVLVLSITENGYGKRTKIDQYRLTQRGGKGVINIKTTKRNGNVVAIMEVSKDIDLMLITRGGKIIRLEADKIRATGRSAQGVTLVNVEDGDQIAAACAVPHSPRRRKRRQRSPRARNAALASAASEPRTQVRGRRAARQIGAAKKWGDSPLRAGLNC